MLIGLSGSVQPTSVCRTQMTNCRFLHLGRDHRRRKPDAEKVHRPSPWATSATCVRDSGRILLSAQDFAGGPIFRCDAKGGLFPFSASCAAGQNPGLGPCVEASFAGKSQSAKFGGVRRPLKLLAGGFLNQRRRYWQVPRLADVAGGASWRAIMLTTGAKEPPHTLPAQVDVTQAP